MEGIVAVLITMGQVDAGTHHQILCHWSMILGTGTLQCSARVLILNVHVHVTRFDQVLHNVQVTTVGCQVQWCVEVGTLARATKLANEMFGLSRCVRCVDDGVVVIVIVMMSIGCSWCGMRRTCM